MAKLQATLTAAIEAGYRPLLDALPSMVMELQTVRQVAAGRLPDSAVPCFWAARRTILRTLAEHRGRARDRARSFGHCRERDHDHHCRRPEIG
jgi:hypothetical protein